MMMNNPEFKEMQKSEKVKMIEAYLQELDKLI